MNFSGKRKEIIHNTYEAIIKFKKKNMEKEILETVLIELLEESKRINLLVEEQNKEIQELKSTISDFNRKLTEIKVSAPSPDTGPLTMIVTEGINSIKKIVDAQPKQVVHEKRVLFFPEWNQKLYYKIIFGRILFWILWVIIVTYCYFLGREYLTRKY
jgi:hypothetical protein